MVDQIEILANPVKAKGLKQIGGITVRHKKELLIRTRKKRPLESVGSPSSIRRGKMPTLEAGRPLGILPGESEAVE